jgi:hypothetical protein
VAMQNVKSLPPHQRYEPPETVDVKRRSTAEAHVWDAGPRECGDGIFEADPRRAHEGLNPISGHVQSKPGDEALGAAGQRHMIDQQ